MYCHCSLFFEYKGVRKSCVNNLQLGYSDLFLSGSSDIWFLLLFYFWVWLGFYYISTIEGHLIPNPLYTCMLINHCKLFNFYSSWVKIDLHIDFRLSRQLRNRCTRSKISRYNLDRGRVELGAFATPTGSRWVSNNYITRCHRHFELVGVSWISSCSLRQWEPAPSRGLGPSGPSFEQPSRMKKKCCYSQRNFGLICCSLFSLQLTSHTQPFRIKCERYIFLKKCVRSSLSLIMFPHVYEYV